MDGSIVSDRNCRSGFTPRSSRPTDNANRGVKPLLQFRPRSALLASGFWLIPEVGLPGTLLVAGSLNALVAFAAWVSARWRDRGVVAPPLPADPAAASQAAGGLNLLLAVAAITGLSSFVYEVVWIRMLSLVLGSSLHVLCAWQLFRHECRDPAAYLAAFGLGLAVQGLVPFLAASGWRLLAAARARPPVNEASVRFLLRGPIILPQKQKFDLVDDRRPPERLDLRDARVKFQRFVDLASLKNDAGEPVHRLYVIGVQRECPA